MANIKDSMAEKEKRTGMFAELKRRKVFRVALAYIVAAWVIMQVVDVMFPALRLPDWTVTFVAVIVLIGFPLAVILAWAFELTPEGIKRDSEVERDTAGRKLDLIIIGVMAVVLAGALGLTWSYLIAPSDDGARVPPLTTDTPNVIRRIAVLPFTNMMNDPGEEYFVDGMTEALITELANIESIKVVSRTSIRRYKDTLMTIPEIASELGVDALIEGSVMKAEGQVRITAKLIDARKDENLWHEDYTKNLENVLQLQADVVLAIAQEINAVLTPLEKSHLANTEAIDPKAYDAYLHGRHLWAKRTKPSIERALEYFEEAILHQPDFAHAYAGLADGYMLLAIYEYHEPVVAYEKVREAATTATQLDPTSGEPYMPLGQVYEALDHDWLRSEHAYRKGIELSPDNAQGYLFYAHHLISIGRLEAAEDAIEVARTLDPLEPLASTFLTQLRTYGGEPEVAIKVAQKALEFDPNFPPTVWRLGEAYLASGNYDLAVETFEKMVQLTKRHPFFLSYLGMAYGKAGSADRAHDIIKEIQQATPWPACVQVSWHASTSGSMIRERAIEALDASLSSAQMILLGLYVGTSVGLTARYRGIQIHS